MILIQHYALWVKAEVLKVNMEGYQDLLTRK